MADRFDMSGVLTGGCLCGAVRYTVAPGLRMKPYACHCTDCQRRSGSSFGIQLGIMEPNLQISGELIAGEHIQPSGAKAGIFACAKCLTRLYTTNDRRPGIINLRAGTLDASPELVPAAHLWVKSKQPWLVLPEGVPALDEQPQTPEEWRELLF
jgi:hypothetical protein